MSTITELSGGLTMCVIWLFSIKIANWLLSSKGQRPVTAAAPKWHKRAKMEVCILTSKIINKLPKY